MFVTFGENMVSNVAIFWQMQILEGPAGRDLIIDYSFSSTLLFIIQGFYLDSLQVLWHNPTCFFKTHKIEWWLFANLDIFVSNNSQPDREGIEDYPSHQMPLSMAVALSKMLGCHGVCTLRLDNWLEAVRKNCPCLHFDSGISRLGLTFLSTCVTNDGQCQLKAAWICCDQLSDHSGDKVRGQSMT